MQRQKKPIEGTVWKNLKTGKTVRVLNEPSLNGKVELYHFATGRRTFKQRHYFEYDYEIIQLHELPEPPTD